MKVQTQEEDREMEGGHLLTEEAADLGEVDEGTFGSRDRHERQAVVGEGLLLPSW